MSIIVKLPHIDKLDIILKKNKNTYKVFNIDSFPDSEKNYHFYQIAKKLKPFADHKNAYWDFLLLTNPYFFGLDKYKNTHTNVYAQSLYSIVYKFVSTIFLNKSLSLLSLTYYPVYKDFIKLKNNNNLFVGNITSFDMLTEYLFFSEYNNVKSYEENNNVIFLKDFNFQKDSENYEKGLKNLETFIKKNSELNYKVYNDNVCNLDYLEIFYKNNNYKKFDNIFSNTTIYYWSNKLNRSYYDSQSLFNLILINIQYLKLKGNFMFKIGAINSQLSLDIIALLQIYFKEVFIIKSETIRVISDDKIIVAKEFLGINDKDYFLNLKNISREWHNYEKSCGLEIKEGPSKEKYYITSLFNYKNNYKYFKSFISQEIQKKIIMYQKIVKNYNYVKSNYDISEDKGFKAQRFLVNQISQRSIEYLKNNNIPIRVKFRNINTEILNLRFDNLFNETFKRFKNNYKNNINSQDFDHLYTQENRLKIYKRSMDNMNVKKMNNILKNYLKPFKKLREELKLKFFDQNLNQAFIKMYEILNIFNLIDNDNFKSYHLCEAPGGFIKACKYFINKNFIDVDWYWNAQSLHPGKGKALGDDYKLIKNYPSQWDFGKDKSGDITKLSNIKYYAKKISKFDLVTFDCGIDFNETNFKETYQDKVTIMVNFAATLIVLSGMKKGANFVNKVFLPQSTEAIICLNYIIITHFKQCFIFKSPQNPASSEVYIIAKGFKGIEVDLLENIFSVYKSKKFNKFFIDLPLDFVEDYTKIMNFYIIKNIDTLINLNYYYDNYKLFKDDQDYINETIEDNNIKWLKNFNLYK